MLEENPRRRFGSVEAALSHLEENVFHDTSESDDDILDELESELGNMRSRRTIAYVPHEEVQLDIRPNWLRKFYEARPQAITPVVTREKTSSSRDEFSRFIVIALLGLSLVFFLKYVEHILKPDSGSQEAVPTREYSSPTHTIVTQLGGTVSFEIPSDASLNSEESRDGVEVVASTRGGTLKFSSWSIEEDANALSESAVIERLGRGIFKRSEITSIGPLSRTRDGYPFRDFRAEGSAGEYLTRLVLISSNRAVTMSTRGQGIDESFALERVRFIESLQIEAIAAH